METAEYNYAMRKRKIFTCKQCNKSFERDHYREYRFCSSRCASLYNQNGKVNRIENPEEMSRRTMFRRRAELGETQPVKKYYFNESFFFNWSDELAWLIGLIWADGYISRNTIDLCSKDHDLMVMVEGIIGMRGGVRPKNKGRHWRIIFSSKEVADFLRSIGLVQRKSKIITWPSIPAEWEGSFMRGFIDGDGWVSLRMVRPNQQAPDLSVGVCTASKKMFEAIKQWYDKHEINYYAGKVSETTDRVVVSEQDSLRRLYHLLYPGGEWSVALIRKHSKYAMWLSHPRGKPGRPQSKTS